MTTTPIGESTTYSKTTEDIVTTTNPIVTTTNPIVTTTNPIVTTDSSISTTIPSTSASIISTTHPSMSTATEGSVSTPIASMTTEGSASTASTAPPPTGGYSSFSFKSNIVLLEKIVPSKLSARNKYQHIWKLFQAPKTEDTIIHVKIHVKKQCFSDIQSNHLQRFVMQL